MTRVFSGLDDVAAAIGATVGVSSWVVIDQSTIDSFAEVTGDPQWIHIDPERAREGPYGTTIAHGYLTLSLISRVLAEVLQVEGVGALVNYGTDRVRFPAPVLAGSRVRGHVVFAELRDNPRGALLRSTVTVEIDGSDKPACVADILTLLSVGAEHS